MTLPAREGWTDGVNLLNGETLVNNQQIASAGELALLSTEGAAFSLRAKRGTRLLLMAAEPLNQPVAGQGPFVMNIRKELMDTISDYQNGKFGHIPANAAGV